MRRPLTESLAVPVEGDARLGLRANLAQFLLLVAVNAFVGGMVGLERSVLPVLAERDFGLASRTAILSFLISFGLVKAASNYAAGRLADRVGRKQVLLLGWVAALPVAPLIILAPSWGWVVVANVFLGVNQGLAWSTTVNMKIDLVGPARRGLAMGLNEAAGYGAVAVAALAAGYLAATYGPRPAPFLLGVAFAGAGLFLSAVVVKDTGAHVTLESRQSVPPRTGLGGGALFLHTSFRDRNLSSACQAGLVNNLNDAMAWGLLPLYFAAAGLPLTEIAILSAAYPAVWSVGQLATGWASDYVGRKWLIAGGMAVQAIAIMLIALSHSFGQWLAEAVLLGIGTAMVYPTLLAAVSDASHPSFRASAIGIYRFWRDSGYAVGAIVAGVTADVISSTAAIELVAGLTAISAAVVALRMIEKNDRPLRPQPAIDRVM